MSLNAVVDASQRPDFFSTSLSALDLCACGIFRAQLNLHTHISHMLCVFNAYYCAVYALAYAYLLHILLQRLVSLFVCPCFECLDTDEHDKKKPYDSLAIASSAVPKCDPCSVVVYERWHIKLRFTAVRPRIYVI